MSYEVALVKADSALRAGRFSEALRHFEAAIREGSVSIEACMGRAEALEALGRFEESIEQLRAPRPCPTAASFLKQPPER